MATVAMSDQIELFTLQLRAQLAGLREVAVQGRWEGPAPAALPRALIATRLLAGSSDLLGLSPLAAWLRVLLDLLTWISEHPDGSLACYEPVLREVVALEEQLIERLDAGEDPSALVADERVAALRRAFAGAERAWAEQVRKARAARAGAAAQATAPGAPGGGAAAGGPGEAAAGAENAPVVAGAAAPARGDVQIGGLDDLQATLGWERFLECVERLITRVPHPRCPDDPDDPERVRMQGRWREVRALGDFLFQIEDETGPAAAVAAGEILLSPTHADLPGGALFREALLAGCREGLAAAGRDEFGACDEPPWALRWRVPGLTPAGLPAGAVGVDEMFDADEQRRYGRLLGLMAADLTAASGVKSPPWGIFVELAPERVQVEFRRPPSRCAPETVRLLAHLMEQDFLLELPNLRAALRRLKKDGALVDSHFGPRGEGRLQVVLPARLTGQVEVCVLPLHDQRLAAPIHLVEGVVPLTGWQRRVEAEGEILVKGDARLLLVDLAAGVEGLLPVDLEDPRTHVALVGLVEKRVAFLTTGPGSRLAVRAYGAAPAGWQAVASGSVTLAEGGTVPLLDIEQVIALRLRQDAGEAGLGGADAGAREWSPRGAGPGAPPARAAAGTGTGVAAGPAPAERRASGRIVLLVASRFRAADLEERLLQARFEVLPCATPQEAWSRLQEGPVAAVVCDNAEPTHWLRALAELRAEQVGRFPCPVVLVATATNDAVRRLARQLGAAGVWTPPFLVDDLRAHLA